MAEKIIELKNVTYTYPLNSAPALKDISLREAETALRNMPETKFDIINKK